MAKHERVTKTTNKKADQKRRLRKQDPQSLLEQQDLKDHGPFTLIETPFHPKMDEHASLLVKTPPGQHLTNFVLQLEQTYGNRYVQSLVESVDKKLTASPQKDISEQEADRITDMVTINELQRQAEEGEQTQEEGEQTQAQTGGVIANAFANFSGSCVCGERFRNNCAHFLSDALIRGGCSEIDGGSGALYRRRNGFVVCKAGRPIRAKELRSWLAGKATEMIVGEPEEDGYFVVYQHDGYAGGHVLIHKHKGAEYEWKGTGNHPDWGTQEHYRW